MLYVYSGIAVLVLILAVWSVQTYRKSFFMSPMQRVNIGIWGKRSMIISYNLTAPRHTLIMFSNTYPVDIPGGLQGYTIGALGKLVALEKKPLIYKKALSAAGDVLVHKVQYQTTDDIYYDDYGNMSEDVELQAHIRKALFGPGELTLFERLFLWSRLSEITSVQTARHLVSSQKPDITLYEKAFRNEKKLVQIRYAQGASSAFAFAGMLENIGIRVADSMRVDRDQSMAQTCTVMEADGEKSATAAFIVDYFGCAHVTGQTGLYEIIFTLGPVIEQEWGNQ